MEVSVIKEYSCLALYHVNLLKILNIESFRYFMDLLYVSMILNLILVTKLILQSFFVLALGGVTNTT